MPSRVHAALRRPGRIFQLLRYSAVSGVSTGTSLTVLGVLVGVFGVNAVIANVCATAVGTVPSFELNRRWVWFDHSKRSVPRQVAPFCMLSLAGLAISTLTVRVVSARTIDFGRGWHTLAVEGANLAAYASLWVVQFLLLDLVLFRQRRPSGAEPGAVSGDHAVLAQVGQFGRTETQLVGEDVGGVLAQPGHPRLGALGHLGELHGEPGDQHGLGDAVGARVLDEHVAPGQVGVGDDLLVVGHRSRHEPGCVQGVAGLPLGPGARPGLQGRPDVRLEVVEPALGRGETRVVDPLRAADGAGQVGPL